MLMSDSGGTLNGVFYSSNPRFANTRLPFNVPIFPCIAAENRCSLTEHRAQTATQTLWPAYRSSQSTPQPNSIRVEGGELPHLAGYPEGEGN